jgi:hypothetical protein
MTACGGLMEGEDFEDRALGPCPTGLKEWAQGTSYRVGEQVTFQGRGFFQANQAHTAFDPGWTPVAVPALWAPISCQGNPAGGGAVTPPPAPPAPPAPPVAEPPPPPPAGGGAPGLPAQCQANGRPGPLFDVAGDKNIGNNAGTQFIGGRCLSNRDCASNCCARPCGICSGPGAQFQAGKQGCGFPN